MASINIGFEMTKMREEIPPELRVVGTMRELAHATEHYAYDAMNVIFKEALKTHIQQTLFGQGLVVLIAEVLIIFPQYKALMEDLTQIRLRVKDVYLPAMAELPDDAPMPEAVKPLFFNIAGAGFFTPDALGPASILNQFAELNAVNKKLASNWRRSYMSAAGDMALALGKGIKESIPDIPALVPVAGFALLALGVFAFATAKGRR